ncbi:hypothetical protein JCM8097_009429 [Rhodosporidiobolus ruineniae]
MNYNARGMPTGGRTPEPGGPAVAKTPVPVESSFCFTYSLDFEANLTDENLEFRGPLREAPLVGRWQISARREKPTEGEQGEGKIAFNIGHEDLPYAFLGHRVAISMKLSWADTSDTFQQMEDWTWPIKPFPDRPADSSLTYSSFGPTLVLPLTRYSQRDDKYDPVSQRRYRMEVTIAKDFTDADSRARTLAEQVTAFDLLPQDVRLFFPRANRGQGAELWTSGRVLEASRYFRSLSDPIYTESLWTSAVEREDGLAPRPGVVHDGEPDIEDSDDEVDKFLCFKHPPSLHVPPLAELVRYKQLDIRHNCVSTYHALLVYLQSRFVHFAPLTSSCAPSNPSSSAQRRRDIIIEYHQKNPSLPLPVSPKSLFRLADYLYLEDLEQVCLDAFRSALTVQCAAHELFSEASQTFGRIRSVAIAFVKDNWEKVQQERSWTAAVRKIRHGEMPEAAPILLELLEAVSKK